MTPMKIMKIVAESAKSVTKHKLRTALIELAILVGIATLTVVVSLTQGANMRIMKRIRNFGPDAIMLHSGGGKMRGPSTAAQIARMIKGATKTLNIFLWLIAIISPVVGGIVLMNIMLMAVAERKREIGLRRALGARKSHIIFQFLSESVILTFSGGLLGVGVGVIIALLVRHLGKPIAISWQPFVIAFVVSVLIGLFFGVYPAKKAANLDPVDALNQQ